MELITVGTNNEIR